MALQVNTRSSEIAASISAAVLESLFEGIAVDNKLNRARELFVRWRAARPELTVRQSPYAQSLVREMIAATQELIGYMHGSEHVSVLLHQLDELHALLAEEPPPLPPQTPVKRGLSFYKKTAPCGAVFVLHNLRFRLRRTP